MTRFGKIIIPLVAVLTAVAAITLLRRPVRMTFTSPKQAAEQLVVALRADDLRTAELILGRGSDILIRSGDDLADKDRRRRFVAAYDKHTTFAVQNPSRVTLLVGADNWPFPIPLINETNGWRFNIGAGVRELVARRIGRDEVDAINECKAFVAAEREYAAVDSGDSVLEYAQRLSSTGQREDGLYWPAGKRRQPSPLGPAFARAEVHPGRDDVTPYDGYYFRVLAAQGPAARGGAYSYLAHGRMIGGFALIAFPAKYGSTGIMTFIVNDDDTVFQNDLGADTRRIAERTMMFNPGRGWSRAKI